MSPSFSGAFDLSKLKVSSPTQPNPAAVPGPAVNVSDDGLPTVQSYLVAGDESTLRNYLQLSAQVVVLMLFSSEGDPELTALRANLTEALTRLQGRAVAIEIAAASSPQLAQAVGVTATPSVVAVIAGQPAPLFQGSPDPASLASVLAQVIELATQNGVTGRAAVGNTAPQQSPGANLSPEHQAAADALDRGDLGVALASYEAILRSAPNDQDAKIGISQAKFLIRLQSAKPNQEGVEAAMQQADLLYAAGDLAAAFNLLLDEFASADPDDRQQLRARLLEFFLVAGDDDQSVRAARSRLASLLF